MNKSSRVYRSGKLFLPIKKKNGIQLTLDLVFRPFPAGITRIYFQGKIILFLLNPSQPLSMSPIISVIQEKPMDDSVVSCEGNALEESPLKDLL